MSPVRVVAVREYDLRVEYLAENMGDEDRSEVKTATNKEPAEALEFAVFASRRCFLVLSERLPSTWVPVAIFGVADSVEQGHGVCWFLGTDLTFSEMKHIRKATPSWLDVLGKGYTVLHNVLDARNTGHFRWCVDAGFKPDGIREINGHTFIHIVRQVSPCVIPQS